jgi:hypothetical protein
MYDIRQFKPVLYALVTIGIVGFSMAAQTPGLFILAIAFVSLNAWLVATDRFVPMPRLMANVITTLAFLFIVTQVWGLGTTPIILVGQFLVLLQIIKLFEQRANRDYAQLLILSLLLMVAASISTASLLFGLLFIVYLFLSLYCCLLFHLKVETDYARGAYALAEERLGPSVLRQDQRHLSQSMRRLTMLVATTAIITASVVFLVFPRGMGSNFLGSFPLRPGQTLTGFSDQLSFQQIANITQNTDPVAYVHVYKNNQPAHLTQLYLRGTTFDTYEAIPAKGWRWKRSQSTNRTTRIGQMFTADDPVNRVESIEGGTAMTVTDAFPTDATLYRQRITLLPTGTRTLFAMPFPVEFKPARRMDVRYNSRNATLYTVDSPPPNRQIEYEVTSTNESRQLTPAELTRLQTRAWGTYDSNIDPRIKDYIKQIDLADLLRQRQSGPDAKQGWAPHPLDEQIAREIEHHLQTTFAYTLDLTEFGQTHDDDPIVRFLYDFKRGHCEYFAGAMALLCQSLDIRARVVVGFKTDEYGAGDMFTVRQSHAHAWVEVQTPSGWKTFDPTSGRDVSRASLTLMQRIRGWMNLMEFKWANSVIAYDTENRDNLIADISSTLDRTTVNSAYSINQWLRRLQNQFGNFASRIVGPIVFALIGGLFFAIAWFLWERWRLRKRAERIGLDILPAIDQMRLVRQLGFYDELLRLLERHQIRRSPHFTPMEFADSLAFLPSETYDVIRRLTRIFYRIRFGRMKLTAPQQRRLHTVLQKLAQSMQPPQ